MNLENDPSIAEFRVLLSECDDQNFSHKIWVSKEGDVHFTRIPIGHNIDEFFDTQKLNVQFHIETQPYKGNYTGPIAAEDDRWVSRLYNALVQNWNSGKTGRVERY